MAAKEDAEKKVFAAEMNLGQSRLGGCSRCPPCTLGQSQKNTNTNTNINTNTNSESNKNYNYIHGVFMVSGVVCWHCELRSCLERVSSLFLPTVGTFQHSAMRRVLPAGRRIITTGFTRKLKWTQILFPERILFHFLDFSFTFPDP